MFFEDASIMSKLEPGARARVAEHEPAASSFEACLVERGNPDVNEEMRRVRLGIPNSFGVASDLELNRTLADRLDGYNGGEGNRPQYDPEG